jgi:taurine dioxygenase
MSLDDYRQRMPDLFPPWGPRTLQRLSPTQSSSPYTRFNVRPLGPVIGAEIEGIDLSQKLHPEDKAEVHRALLEWKVLAFQGQAVSHEDIYRFACEWGEPLDASLLQTGADGPDVFYANGSQNYWHADDSYLDAPGTGSVLHVAELPALGGDTLFVDMSVAFDNLDADTKAAIVGLRAVHDCAPYAAATPHYRDHLEEIAARFPPVEHSVVRVHPETGREILYVNAMWTTHLVDVEPGTGDALLLRLCLQATIPEYQCRLRWTRGQVVLWDNLAVQHYAVSDYSDPRLMVRTSFR